MKKIVINALILIVALTACGLAEDLNIVCAGFPCYDFARQLAGEGAEVSMLMKPGMEPHAFDPTPADILAIGNADLFVCIGGESDAWVSDILSSFGDDAPETLVMMDAVTPIEEEAGVEHYHDEGPEYDEHIWTSPKNAIRMIELLRDKLCEIDSECAGVYTGNAQAYIAEIDAIDTEIRAIVEAADHKTLIFADRFPFIYFVREYGLDYLAAFPSCTAETEPSAQTVTTLIKRVVEDKIPAVYTIEMSTQSIAKTIAEETGVEVLTLQSIQTVSQSDFDAGKTYVSIMRENVDALKKGLN